jgi:hypothetical protein
VDAADIDPPTDDRCSPRARDTPARHAVTAVEREQRSSVSLSAARPLSATTRTAYVVR